MAHDDDRPSDARSGGRASLADMVVEEDAVCLRSALPPAARLKLVVIGGLLVLLNFWQFRPLINAWLHDENWGHGFIIPLFSLYLLYRRGGELVRAPRRACAWGLVLLLAGIVAMIVGFYPIGMRWLSRLSMCVMLFGAVLYLAGPAAARITWLPIFYLAFAMPIPRMLYTRIATPLQELAAQSSCLLLKLFGARIDIVASHMEIVSRSGKVHELTVVEACSGVRSLLAYVALGVAWAYLEERPVWQRVVLVLCAVPIALLCNVARVTGTAWMFVIDRPELGMDFMHKFMGLAMLLPAVVLFWLLGLLLQKLYVEEEEPHAEGGAAVRPDAPKRSEGPP